MLSRGAAHNAMRIAVRLALLGFLIEMLFLSFWLLDDRFNFFHLPAVEQADQLPGNYSQPSLRAWLEDANFILCPPLVATSFAGMDLGGVASIILALIAAALNAALYFVVGLTVARLRNKMGIRRARSPSWRR